MARPEVPDTSALLEAVRRPDRWPGLQRSLQSGRVWLSSVVLAELYAGTRSPEEGLLLDRIVAAMQRVERVLTPSNGDWARAGRLIARRTRLQGRLRPRDHLADVLILVSAARLNGVVVTANLRHFEAWARLATAAGLDVAVRSSAEGE
ncbi:MAG: type II toxin-antitoxin system VapC family toxin [Chloroflexi bacterium]|nr:type II toxin-antitoxin system VapC family toxin [Chloroflexota bacterium]